MDRLSLVILTILSFVALIMYDHKGDPGGMIFVLFLSVIWFGLTRFLDYLKERRLKKDSVAEVSTKSNAESSLLKERLENLEALMCRLDTEINAQLEQSLSGGRMSTGPGPGGVSQTPTTFMNVASVLEERYQVLREIGRGGMGIVFQAHDKQLNEQVAIKILSPLLGANTEAVERLRREVSVARRITHPNIIRIHDIGEAKGLQYVSMEYFHGVNLKEHIAQSGVPSFQQAGNIAMQICDGLEAAHQLGVIHRDLKSQNVIINPQNQIKIIDFGLARTAHLDGMTATGLIMGTPEYMAPEQVSGKKADERSDVYSLGIMLYELFTGKVPFTGDSAIAIGFKQLKEEPAPPSALNPQITPELERVILKALQKDPIKRHRSVTDLRSDLKAILQPGGPAVSQRGAAPAERQRAEIKS